MFRIVCGVSLAGKKRIGNSGMGDLALLGPHLARKEISRYNVFKRITYLCGSQNKPILFTIKVTTGIIARTHTRKANIILIAVMLFLGCCS